MMRKSVLIAALVFFLIGIITPFGLYLYGTISKSPMVILTAYITAFIGGFFIFVAVILLIVGLLMRPTVMPVQIVKVVKGMKKKK